MSTLNADVLAIVASFLDTYELLQIGLASRALRELAYPFLYSDIHVDTLPRLLSVADTIRRIPHLAPHVRSLTEAVSSCRPFYAGVSPSQWPEYMMRLLELLESARSLTRLALSVPADFCGDAQAQMFRPRLLWALSGLVHLTHLAITDVDFTALDLLDTCAPLRVLHLSPSHTEWIGASETVPARLAWIAKMFSALDRHHVHTLVELNIPYASVVQKPQFAHIRMSALTTLIIPEGVTLYPEVAATFPNLRHLRVGVGPHCLKEIDKVWPSLEHLELESCEAGILSPEHHIRSLSIRIERDEFRKYVPSLASPHVESLKLRWEVAPPRMRDIGDYFPNVKYVDLPMTLDRLLAMWDSVMHKCPNWDSQIEMYDFTIKVMPPPAVDWVPNPPLEYFAKAANPQLRAIVIS
ncbi:hypothetical protein AURDEDRAFT_186091 [Auricularia subglabra TFB-10046 SS5]|nr:hypothetical protein AURDEDRAFT_186091 [Auricularia subglabra TFB-10046 SS5]